MLQSGLEFLHKMESRLRKRCTSVMIALRSFSLRALCSLRGDSSLRFVTVSPEISTKSLLMHPLESIARNASPIDVLLELTTIDTCNYCIQMSVKAQMLVDNSLIDLAFGVTGWLDQ